MICYDDNLYVYVAGFHAYDKGGMDLRKFGNIVFLFLRERERERERERS